jgi:hypothetical protein
LEISALLIDPGKSLFLPEVEICRNTFWIPKNGALWRNLKRKAGC